MAKRSEWADFFNGHAPVYETNVFTKNTVAEADFLVRELGIKPGQSILDLGCGTGRHSIELARRGFRLTGLDISAGMLAEAKKRAAAANVDVTWIEANAADFSLPGRFDAAICLCEGAFGLLGTDIDPIGQPLAILRNMVRAMKPDAPCLFTVLNGYKMARKHTQESVNSGAFDPLSLAERSDCAPDGATGITPLRECGFIPTELVLLFAVAGLEVNEIWGGTAGNWGKRSIDLDEYEIMILARKVKGTVALEGLDTIMTRIRGVQQGKTS